MNHQPLVVNYNKIVNDPVLCSITKMTAYKIMKNPYMTLGDFFKELSVNDLQVLLFIVEEISNKRQLNLPISENICDIIVLVEMLSRAEGTESNDYDIISANVDYFCRIITFASLAHKNIVTMNWENVSFGLDMQHLEICKLNQ